MRLFVEGLAEEAAPPFGESSAAAPQPVSSAAGERDEIPRTIKPTVFSWILIVVLVAGAGAFVLYKKTSLFGTREVDSPIFTPSSQKVQRTPEIHSMTAVCQVG